MASQVFKAQVASKFDNDFSFSFTTINKYSCDAYFNIICGALHAPHILTLLKEVVALPASATSYIYIFLLKYHIGWRFLEEAPHEV